MQARCELGTCELGQKTERRAKLDALLEAAVAKASSKCLTPRSLIEITAEAYQEFKLARKKSERARQSDCVEPLAADVRRASSLSDFIDFQRKRVEPRMTRMATNSTAIIGHQRAQRAQRYQALRSSQLVEEVPPAGAQLVREHI